MIEWREVRLGDLLKVKHGFAFKGQHFREEGSLIVLTPGNFYERGGFKPKNGVEKFYDGPVPSEYLLAAGQVVIAMTEQAAGLLGSSATVPADDVYLHNQRIGLVIEDPVVACRRFLYYLFNCPEVRTQIAATATGSKVRHTAPERIHAVRTRVPDVGCQRRIATVLSIFDQLVESNQRRIEILEETARSLYREWFVRYRFPGHESAVFADSSFGRIPGGWVVASLGKNLEFVMGQSPPSAHYNDEETGLPFHQGVGSYGRRYPRHQRWTSQWTKEATAGDALVSVRAPVGRLNIADRRLALGRGVAAVRPTDGLRSYWFEALRHIFRDEDSFGGGTIFKAVTRDDLSRIEFLLPTVDLRREFDSHVGPLAEHDHQLDQQIRAVTAARDLLLPRLVTGKIDVDSLGVDDVFGWAELAAESVAAG